MREVYIKSKLAKCKIIIMELHNNDVGVWLLGIPFQSAT